MVACLSCTPGPLPIRNPFLKNSKPSSFNSREALFLLQKCTNLKHLKQIHVKIIKNNLFQNQLLVTKLLRLCFSHKKTDYATLIFHQIQNPLIFTWNVMIRAYTLNETPHQALLLYNLMIALGVPPDKFTFPFVIKACLVSSAIEKGKEVHAFAVKTGFFGDVFVQNTLMDLYFKCGDSVYGQKVFDKMPVRSVVSWATMVTGLVYCGELEAARAVFELIPDRNVVSWTAMINGYARNRQPEEAFELFRQMQLDNVKPNEFTLVSLLVACTELGSLKLGNRIHDFVLKNKFELSVHLGTALIDMYSKCGRIEEAKSLFGKMKTKSLATWNSMITSLGVHGCGEEALEVFTEMEEENVEPDGITFVGVLCACVHTSRVDEGCRYFEYMHECYGIVPSVEHYTCVVKLLTRAGMLDEVYELVNTMPMELNDDILEALFRASKAQCDLELEKVIDKHVKELDHSGANMVLECLSEFE